ncbi:MAG: glycosyltransferase family 4 protein [Desulfobacterales bacterium]|nr:glycosyltransferase family 4 protein [Desulfobacterales bacterium]
MSRHNGKRVKNTWANKKIYKSRCHYIFTTSKDSKNHLKQTFALSDMQIFSIPDGTIMPDTDVFPNNTAQTAARQKLAKALGLGTDARFIGVFDKTAPQSKQQLCTVSEQLRRQFPSHYLVVAGIHKDRNTMCEPLTPRVHLLPQRQEKNAFYQALDCCVYFPDSRNFYQGVPLEVTRAMACFCPVIGPDAPGIRDILIDQKTGGVFDPKQPESLSRRIQWTLTTPRVIRTQTQEARAMVEQHYTMDAMGRDIMRIYRLRQIKVDRSKLQMIS